MILTIIIYRAVPKTITAPEWPLYLNNANITESDCKTEPLCVRNNQSIYVQKWMQVLFQSTSCPTGILDIFIVRNIWCNFVYFGGISLMRTLCDAFYEEDESHQRAFLDILYLNLKWHQY